MGNFNPTYNNRVRFIMQSEGFSAITITEPIGWRTDEKEYARNKKYHGIITKFSNNLKFIDNGMDFIDLVRDIGGINAEIRLIRDEKHPKTDLWTRTYDGFLDLSTYSKSNNQVSLKFNSSGLSQILKSRQNQKVEIERLDTIDGITLPELETKTVTLDGRRIFLSTKLEVIDTENVANVFTESNAGNTRNQTCGIPLKAITNSHGGIVKSVTPQTVGTEDNGTSGMMFISPVDRDRTFNIDLNCQLDVFVQRYEQIDWAVFRICLTTYAGGSSFNTINRRVLYDFEANVPSFGDGNIGAFYQVAQPASCFFNDDIFLASGQSLAFEIFEAADFHVDNNAALNIYAQNIVADCKIEEDSYTDPTNTKTVLAYELAERLIQITTNRDDAFYSEALGRIDIGYDSDGVNTGALNGFAHGHWIRQFDKLPLPQPETATESEVVNKYKYLTTSFKDFMQNQAVTWNLGMGIEKIGFKERIRIEKLSHFYNGNVTIKLPNQVKNVKRKEAKEFYFSSLQFGYEKGGEYEEAMGLDEYNSRSTFTTIINKIGNVYRQVSKYRYDPYGKEFPRRKPSTNNNTEDTRYDKDIFGMDLKRSITGIFEERKWQDDFSQEPTGVFSPETATNLRLSPFNLMLRHGWYFGAGFTKYLSDYVRYGSSEANSNLKTKSTITGIEYAENGNIINSELERAKFVPEWIEFEHMVDFDVSQQIEGTTTLINGEKINNFYGLVEFINEDNEKEKGYLFSLKVNGKGKWQVLKANR